MNNLATSAPTGAALLAQRPALQQLLAGLPMLAFSDKGRANLCQRFGLTDTELTAVLAAFEKGEASE